MAVYTEVSDKEAQALLHQLQLGDLKAMKGCSGGIENTNYFVTTEREGQVHEYVLTLFERLTSEQLPFYLRLMKHLAQRGIPVPDPSANAKGELKGLEIDPSIFVPSEKQVVEDLILAAIKDAQRRAQDRAKQETERLAGDMGLPPGMKLPF